MALIESLPLRHHLVFPMSCNPSQTREERFRPRSRAAAIGLLQVLPEQTTRMRRAEAGSLIFYLLDVN